jgi:hypothetical protein
MKKTLFLLFVLLFLPTTMVQAQTAVTLESLDVEFWPDYDQEAVLVLLTGSLPASAPLPATLTIPLPDGADFNVVARITEANEMTDQGMNPDLSENQVSFTLSERRFRVEYYQPYTVTNTQRSFTFSWQSEIAVNQMMVTLQQPFTATEVTTVPPAISVSEGQDSLTYHVLPSQAVPAGDLYSVAVNYTMSTPALTVDFLVEDTAAPITEELPFLDAVPVENSSGFDWQLLLIVLGVLILVATGIWFVLNNRGTSKRRPAKPKPQRTTKQAPQKTAVAPHTSSPAKTKTKANFCHQCGESLTATDKFCRSCGTAVKTK